MKNSPSHFHLIVSYAFILSALSGCSAAIGPAISGLGTLAGGLTKQAVEENVAVERETRENIAMSIWQRSKKRVNFGKKLNAIQIYNQGFVRPYECKIDDKNAIILVAYVVINDEARNVAYNAIAPERFKLLAEKDKDTIQYCVAHQFRNYYKLPEKSLSAIAQPTSEIHNWPKGMWQGQAKNVIYEDIYRVNLTVADYRKDDTCGSVTYEFGLNNCISSLLCLGMEDKKYILREKIDSGKCIGGIDGGFIYLDRIGDNNLKWEWFYPGGIKSSEGILSIKED